MDRTSYSLTPTITVTSMTYSSTGHSSTHSSLAARAPGHLRVTEAAHRAIGTTPTPKNSPSTDVLSI